MQFYSKFAPNYIVGLVQKVIDENDSSDINKFYSTCIYCKVEYQPEKSSVKLLGLHRVKLLDIKSASIKLSEN